jgi:hypothetical protein
MKKRKYTHTEEALRRMRARRAAKEAARANKIINRITSIRTKNNVQWMNMLKLAYASEGKKAAKIMNQIVANDKAVTKWMARLGR